MVLSTNEKGNKYDTFASTPLLSSALLLLIRRISKPKDCVV